MVFVREISDFALPEGAKRAPNLSQIASKMSFGLKIYENLLREGSKRAPKQKKVVSLILERILALEKTPEEKNPVCSRASRPLGEPNNQRFLVLFH